MEKTNFLSIILLGLVLFSICQSINQVNAGIGKSFSAEKQRVYFYHIKTAENTASGEKRLKDFQLSIIEPNYTLDLTGATIESGKVLSLEIIYVEHIYVNALITIDRMEYGTELTWTGWSGNIIPRGKRVDPFFFKREEANMWERYQSNLKQQTSFQILIENNQEEFRYTVHDPVEEQNETIVYLKDGMLKSYSGTGTDWKLSFELESSIMSMHGLMGVELIGIIVVIFLFALALLFVWHRGYYTNIIEGISQSYKLVIFGYQEYEELTEKQSPIHVILFVVSGIALSALARSFPLSWLTAFPFWIWISFVNYFIYEATRAIIWIGLSILIIMIISEKKDLKKAVFQASYTYGNILFIFNVVVYLLFVNVSSPGSNFYGPIIIQYFNPCAAVWILMCGFYQIRTTGIPKVTSAFEFSSDKDFKRQYAIRKLSANIGAFAWVLMIVGVHFVLFTDYFSPACFAEFIQLNRFIKSQIHILLQYSITEGLRNMVR